MSRKIPVKSLTVLACLALPGIALTPVGAHAAPPVHITPSMGHPVMFDLRDQTRFPKIEGQVFNNDPGPPSPGPTGPWRILKKPVHPNPSTYQAR